MNCEKFESLVSEIARGDLQDVKLLQDATGHAASCTNCDELLTEYRALSASISALAAHDKLAQPPAHLESSLRAAFVREHELVCYDPADTRSPRQTPRWLFAGAVAAVAAAVLLGILPLTHWMNRKTPIENVAVAPPSPVVMKTISPPTGGATSGTQAPSAIKSHSSGLHSVADHHKKNPIEPESTLTGFLLLPYADDPSTIRSGTVVRLTMSHSELAWLGLPVTVSATAEKTVADLFVNESGTPEAIRLVH